jgi:hypothetical protein
MIDISRLPVVKKRMASLIHVGGDIFPSRGYQSHGISSVAPPGKPAVGS